MTVDPTEVHFLYLKKSQLQNLSTQKIPTFLTYLKRSHSSSKLHFYVIVDLMNSTMPKKNPCFIATQKIPVSSIYPKKSVLAKISDLKNPLDPPPPPPKKKSVNYVTGVPGHIIISPCHPSRFVSYQTFKTKKQIKITILLCFCFVIQCLNSWFQATSVQAFSSQKINLNNWRAQCKNGLSDDFEPPTKPQSYLLSCNATVAKGIMLCC